MPTPIRFLTSEEFAAAEDARMALGQRRARGDLVDGRTGASLAEILPAGSIWEARWYFDPTNPDGRERRRRALERLEAKEEARDYLSPHYWRDWSALRPPYCVLCPNGEEWCIDAKSSNGDGWKVTGSAPLITAHPSIVVPGYHGFLQKGVFTDDIENRGVTGVRRLGPLRA